MHLQQDQASPSQQQEYGARANAFPDWLYLKYINGTAQGFALVDAALAAGESMTIDVIRTDTGASLLTAPLALVAATPARVRQRIPFNQALYDAVPGGTPIRIDGTYVAGGGPANPTVGVFVHIGAGMGVGTITPAVAAGIQNPIAF